MLSEEGVVGGQIDASIAAWNRLAGILEQHLAQGAPFMTGASFTLADIVIGLSLARWQLAPIARPDYPAAGGSANSTTCCSTPAQAATSRPWWHATSACSDCR